MKNTIIYDSQVRNFLNGSYDYIACGAKEIINKSMEFESYKIINTKKRAISPYYIVGEALWYFTNRHSLEHISAYSKVWERLSDDGLTCRSAYGYLWKFGHGFDQVEQVIRVLKNKPDSRQAIIHLHKPNQIETKDEICTLTLQLLIRKNKLLMVTNMRSNDITFGTPYDVTMFQMLQQYIALRIGVRCGTQYHNAASFHMYERDESKYIHGSCDYTTTKTGFETDIIFWDNFDKLALFECALREDIGRPHGSTHYLEMFCELKLEESPLLRLMSHIIWIKFKVPSARSYVLSYINKYKLMDEFKDQGLFHMLCFYHDIDIRTL